MKNSATPLGQLRYSHTPPDERHQLDGYPFVNQKHDNL